MLKLINIFVKNVLKLVNMNVKVKLFSVGVIFFMGGQVIAQKKKIDSAGTKDIEEIVVVAFGKQKKETVVGSNAQIKTEQISQRSLTNVANAIEGAAPGIQIAAGSGQPGSSPTIRIRGFSSITASNNPLYIVDGVIYNTGIGQLNPDDIETINVLKDAASTSLYGSGAANGVILVTTKKGKKDRSTLNFTVSTGFSNRAVSQYDRVGPKDYYLLAWESLRNGYALSNPTATQATANLYATNNLITVLKQNVYNVADNTLVVDGILNPNAKLKYTDLDWDREVAKTGFRQNYDLSFSGGNDKTTYYASLGYLNESGYIIKSDIQRFTGRLNVDTKLKDWLKVGMNLAANNSFGNNAIDGADNATSLVNPYYFSRRMGPIYSPFLHNADGSNVYDADGNKVFDYNQVRGGDAYSGRHTIMENLLNLDYSKNYNINSRINTEIRLMPELTFTSNVGYDTRNFLNKSFTNKIVGDAAPAGSASRTTSTTQSISWVQLLNYKKRFGGHSLDLMMGHETTKLIYEYIYGYKKGQVSDNNDELVNFITPTTLTSYSDNYRKEGYFSRFNYDFKEKYLLSASVRRDASSRFSPETRWHNFWSLGLGWRLNQEKFIANLGIFNELKLRGSYGEVGNEAGIGYYAYQDTFSLGFNNTSEPGFYLGQVADKAITWESNNQKDLALDFGILNNRISGTVEVYKRFTEGLLFNVPTPGSAGIPGNTITRNVGTLYNQGVEIQLNVVPIKTESFSWDLFINASTNKNEVTKLPDGQTEIINGTKKYMVGRSIFDYWLRQWYGVDPTDGAGLFYAADAYVGTTATDVRVINGTTFTTNSNKAKYDYSGVSSPDWFGSFGTNFRIGNFETRLLFTYQIGGKIYDTNYAQLMGGYPQGTALSTDILNRWQKPGDVTEIPRLDTTTYTQYAASSTRWLTDASFINFKSFTVSYNFRSETLKQYGMNTLRLFVNGENVWAKTARKGMEPAENFSGTTVNRYSPSRIFSLGLNVSF